MALRLNAGTDTFQLILIDVLAHDAMNMIIDRNINFILLSYV